MCQVPAAATLLLAIALVSTTRYQYDRKYKDHFIINIKIKMILIFTDISVWDQVAGITDLDTYCAG